MRSRIFRCWGLSRLVPTVLLLGAIATTAGCSKSDEDNPPSPNTTSQAQATQSSIASAQAVHDHAGHDMPQEGPTATGDPMAMGAGTPQGGDAAPSGPMAAVAAPSDGSPMNGMPAGMARMLGQPPMQDSTGGAGGLPSAIGAPHIYHVGADGFFLDQATAIGLTGEQKSKLALLQKSAALAYATTQRKMEQADQDLWVLTSSEKPDATKIETKIGEFARLTGQQRMDFLRAVGDAVGILTEAQRKASVLLGAVDPGAMQTAPSASAMTMGDGPPGGMAKKPMGGMGGRGSKGPPEGMKMGGMDAGASGGMGHM
jgi:hypothetical protein